MQHIRFTSTRRPRGDEASPVGIETAIVRGMPPDGGLYVPTAFPALPARVFDPAPLSYPELAELVLAPFFPGWEEGSLRHILDNAYAGDCFDTSEVAPLVPIRCPGLHSEESRISGASGGSISENGTAFWLLELFHGRTGAFKDMALSVLGGFLRESLDRLGHRKPVLVLTATSGDTGSAALEGMSMVPGVHTAVFYPHNGTSDIQRLQMTTTSPERRFVAAVRGNFDDAQSAVKRIFRRAAEGVGPMAAFDLSSANSINIGRLLPQIVYYVAAWRALAARGALGEGNLMHVAVPTGNFGDILAARHAKEMGLPIGKLICASNANKVLADFFATGVYDRRRDLVKTESPSMDILISSNLERLLYMATGSDPVRTASLMAGLEKEGWFRIDSSELAAIADFSSGWCGDQSARATIASVWDTDRRLVDPHTATAIEVASRVSESLVPPAPVAIAATASPYKFPRACFASLSGTDPSPEDRSDFAIARRIAAMTGTAMPSSLAALETRTVHHDRLFDPDEIEAALAAYARAEMRDEP